MHVSSGATVCIAVLAAGTLAGCLGDGPTVTVPLARVGDVVEYDLSRAIDHLLIPPSREVHRFEILGTEEIQHVDGSLLQTVKVAHQTTRPERDPPRNDRSAVLFIDAANNLLVRELDGANVTNFISPQPWTFGSSLMQGQTFGPGATTTVSIPVEGHPLDLTGHTVRTWNEGDQRMAEVRWTSDLDVDIVPKARHAWLTGTVVATDASPYVTSGTLEYGFYNDVLGEWLNVTQSVTRTSYRQGTGDVLAATTSIGGLPQCLPGVGPVNNGLPPGAYEQVGQMRVTFGEFVDVLAEHDAAVRQHLAEPGAYFSNLRIYQTPEPPPTVVLGHTLASAHMRLHSDPGMVDVIEVERTTEWRTVVADTTYSVDRKGQLATSLPPHALRDDMVSVAALLQTHFERYPVREDDSFAALFLVTSDGLSLMPTLSADGQHYDLRTGCLRQNHGVLA